MDFRTLILMIGMSFGFVFQVNLTCMRDWMSIKRSIIFQTRLKSLERTSYALTCSKCKNDMEKKHFTSLLILLSCPMKRKNSESSLKNYKKLKDENRCGLLNQTLVHRVRESILLMIWVSFEQQINRSFQNISPIPYW